MAYAGSDEEAKKIFDAEQAHVTVSGSAVLVKSDSNNNGRMNLTITVPKRAHVTVHSGHGDVTAANLNGGAQHQFNHGDVHLSVIKGSVQVHFSTDKGDFSAHQIDGDITAEGNCNDLTLSEITGQGHNQWRTLRRCAHGERERAGSCAHVGDRDGCGIAAG